LLYGALEPGGLINVISKKPQYQWGTRLSADNSSFGGGSLAVDVTGPIADSGLAFRLIAERQNEDYQAVEKLGFNCPNPSGLALFQALWPNGVHTRPDFRPF